VVRSVTGGSLLLTAGTECANARFCVRGCAEKTRMTEKLDFKDGSKSAAGRKAGVTHKTLNEVANGSFYFLAWAVPSDFH